MTVRNGPAGPRRRHPRNLTYRDREALPDDGRRYEILDGVLSVSRHA